MKGTVTERPDEAPHRYRYMCSAIPVAAMPLAGRKPTMTRPTGILKPDPTTNHNYENLPVDLLLRRVIEEAKMFQAPKDAEDRSKK